MRGLALASIIVTVAACGLGLEGSGDLGVPVAAGSVDAGDAVDAGVDASLPPPPACTPIVVKDALSSIDTATWRVEHDGSNGDYPKVVAPPESPLGSSALSLVIQANDSRGGLWLNTKVPTRAFDVTLSYFIQCTAGCADGLAVAWLKAVDAAVLDTAASGRGFGIPPTIAGGAVAIDLYRNSEPNDPPVPAVEILGIDGVNVPGYYPWIKEFGPTDVTLTGALRKLEIHARAGEVQVLVDGVLEAKGPVPLGFAALFGITAASGGQYASYFIRDFSGTFYDCDP